MLRLYGMMGITGILMVTQLLATLGYIVPLNAYLWMVIGGLGGMIYSLTVSIVRILGYESAYSNT